MRKKVLKIQWVNLFGNYRKQVKFKVNFIGNFEVKTETNLYFENKIHKDRFPQFINVFRFLIYIYLNF